MIEIALLLTVVFVGKLIGYKGKEERYSFLKALALITVQEFVSVLLIVLFLALGAFILSALGTPLGMETLFGGLLFAVVWAGISLYWLMRKIVPKFNLSMTVLTIVEYYIQWSLIYVTVYQVIFDNVFKEAVQNNVQDALSGQLSDPAMVIVLLLPALISTWIAVILYKFDKRAI